MPNLEKLKIIRDVVAGVPDELFDMGDWKCGTVGCAIGHAAPHIGIQIINERPEFDGHRDWNAVEKCLSMSGEDVEHLFYAGDYDEYPDRSAVLTRLDAFIAKHEGS